MFIDPWVLLLLILLAAGLGATLTTIVVWIRAAEPDPTTSGDPRGGNGRLAFEADAELDHQLRREAETRGLPPEKVIADMLARNLEQDRLFSQAMPGLAHLTRREQQIAYYAARGKTNRQIAGLFFISPETVKSHMAHVLEKLGLYSKADLRVFLLDPGNWRDAASRPPWPPGPP